MTWNEIIEVKRISDFLNFAQQHGKDFQCPYCEIQGKESGVTVKFFPFSFNMDETGRFVIECETGSKDHTIMIESTKGLFAKLKERGKNMTYKMAHCKTCNCNHKQYKQPVSKNWICETCGTNNGKKAKFKSNYNHHIQNHNHTDSNSKEIKVGKTKAGLQQKDNAKKSKSLNSHSERTIPATTPVLAGKPVNASQPTFCITGMPPFQIIKKAKK